MKTLNKIIRYVSVLAICMCMYNISYAADNICSATALSSSSAIAGGTNNSGNNAGTTPEPGEVFGTEYNGEGNSAFNTCEGPGTFTMPGNPGPSDWWTFTPTITGEHCFAETTGFASDHQMAIFEDTGGACPGPNFGALTILGSSDDGFAASVGDGAIDYGANSIGATANTGDAAFCVNLTMGTTYYFQVSSVALFSTACAGTTCDECFTNFDPGGAYTINVSEPPPCEIELDVTGGAGYNECTNLGFPAGLDPCAFCSSSSISIDFGTQPSQACIDEINAGGFDAIFVPGADVVFDGCTPPANAVIGIDCPGGSGFSNVVYSGDGCTFDFITYIQRYNVPDTGAGCPCSGSCTQGIPITQAYGACPQGNDPCATTDLTQLSITPVAGTCDTAPAVTIEAFCPETGVTSACDMIFFLPDPPAEAPACGESGTETFSFDFNDPALQQALMDAGLPLNSCAFSDVEVPFDCFCANCDASYTYSTEAICADDPFTLTVDAATCMDSEASPATGTLYLDLDIYIYAPGGVPATVPPAYDPLAGTGGVDPNFPVSNTDLLIDGGLGGTWNGTICADYTSFATFANATCEPITFSVIMLPWDRQFDTDGDLIFGEYNNVDPATCPIQIYDVTVYPDGLTAVETPGTCNGNPSSVAILAADGSECATETAAAAPADPVCPATDASDMFMYSITAADLGLDMAPAACQPSFMGQIDVPCTAICCDIMDPITMPATICEGDAPVALNASPGGATCTTINWFSDAAGATMVGSGTSFMPTDVAAGTYTYYAQCVDSSIADCESALVPADYTINASPIVSLDTPAFSCGDGAQPLNPSPAGGVYSGSGATTVNTDAISDADLTPGVIYDLTYTVTTPDGCVGSETIQFSFNPACEAEAGSF